MFKRLVRAATATAPALVTVPNVPIVSTGIEYPASTGPVTFTQEDLADAVAAMDDPAVHAPRNKIGHVDGRFNAGVNPDGTFRDGEPTLGTWQNLRLSEDNQTIYADLVGAPAWLADILSSAYPSRSIEGNFEVETVTGHKWRLVIDAVALLGVIGPGVTTLDDLPQLFSAEGPDNVTVIEPKEGEPMGVRAAGAVTASVNMEDVRRSYYEQLDASQMWWWVRAVYLSPNELIVDDDEGGLYRVPFSISGENVNFQDPVEVKIQYVDVGSSSGQKAAASVAFIPSAGRQAAVYASRSESRPGSNNKEVTAMTIDIAGLRTRLGLTAEQLPDDATEDQVNAAIAAQPDPPANPATPDQTDGQGTPADGAAPASPDPATQGQPAAPAQPAEPGTQASLPAGMVAVDEQTLADLRAGAEAGRTVAARLAEQDRDKLIGDAIKAGKFPPARREHWIKSYTADPEGTKAAIASLEPGLVPVNEVGESPTEGDLSTDAYPTHWVPEVAARQAAAGATITQEG